jgi:type VI secretion system protein ImpH
VPLDQQNRLGMMNCALGRDFTVGSRVYSRGCTFRASIGPMSVQEYMDFLPGRKSMTELREMIDLFNGDGLDYEVELIVRPDDVPGVQLGNPGSMLGWASWLGGKSEKSSKVKFLIKGWKHGGR